MAGSTRAQHGLRTLGLVAALLLAVHGTAAAQKIRLQVGVYSSQDTYQELVDMFMARNPDVEVELVRFSNYDDFVEKMPVMIAGGVAPDVFSVHHLDVVEWAKAGRIMPLDEFVARDPAIRLEDYFPFAINAFRWREGSYTVGEGSLYAMPTTFQSPGMPVYNRRLFDEAGVAYPDETWTWDSELEAMRKLTRITGQGTFTTVGTRVPNSREGRFMPRLWQAGGQMISEDYSRPMLASAESIAVLEWLAELVHVHRVANNGAGTFVQGNVGIEYAGQWVMPVNRWHELIEFEWSVFPHPKHPETGSRMIGARPDGMGILATTREPEAAWRVLSFITGPEIQELRATREYQASPHIPSAILLYQAGGQNGVPHNYELMAEALMNVHPTYHLGMNAREIGNVVNTWLSRAVNAQVSPVEAASQMNQEVNAILLRMRE